MLIDNINFLRKRFRSVREQLKQYEDKLSLSPIQVSMSRSGMPTLTIEQEGKSQSIHSMYDPVREAENIAKKYTEQTGEYDHIFFYGIGLGYHVEEVLKSFPDATFSIYEPEPYICLHFLNERLITKDFPSKRLMNFYIEVEDEDISKHIGHFFETTNKKVLLVTLPSYERVFSQRFKFFFKVFSEILGWNRQALHTNLAFEERWTINSTMNFPKVLETTNVIHDVDAELFSSKPAIIISAGPSLNDEIDNLKRIKEEGSAYLFSVGSAINTLLENDLYPDAVCTYDPKQRNQRVFQKVIDQNITEIPIVFGSSVGFETVKNYPSEKKYHMITSQDTVSPYYLRLNNGDPIKRVSDAPSIAVVTLELLGLLGCNPIILVGQNLSFLDNKRHAKGIGYSQEITEAEKKRNLIVTGNDGSQLYTNESFLRMKKELELKIKMIATKNITVINTTKQGAIIEGTSFQPLTSVIEKHLSEKMVKSGVFAEKYRNNYDLSYLEKQVLNMEKEHNEFLRIMKQVIEKLANLEYTLNEQQVIAAINEADGSIQQFLKNDFFKVFIQPMVRVQLDILNKVSKSIVGERDIQMKVKLVKKHFLGFFAECQKKYFIISPLYKDMNLSIEKMLG